MLLNCDARSIELPDRSVHCIVTSPPYWANRSYGTDDREIGKGDLDKYLSDMGACAREWLRVLADDGLCWINLGDTASGSGGAGGDYNAGGAKQGRPRYRQGKSGLKPMQWCNVPHKVADTFVSNGWLLRSCITWDKGMVRPEDLNHVRRPGVSSEFIFMFAKHRSHRFYPERLEERGNVWHFRPVRKANHLAPFPAELPTRCLLPSTVEGETVLDPFAGSGTTLVAAEQHGRIGIGCDIYTPTETTS